MATLVKCDSCNELSDLAPLNWWVLDIFGRKVDVTTNGIFQTPYHFCSLDCVSDFARARARMMEDDITIHVASES